MKQKVTVVGAGNVGATTAQRIFERGYADVVLVDIVPDMPQGKALDILESGPVLGTDALITGSNGYEASAGSDVVVVTAGIARRPGHEPRRPAADKHEDRRRRYRRGRKVLAGLRSRSGLQSTRRHGPTRPQRLWTSPVSESSAWPASSTPQGSAHSWPAN